MKFKLPLNIGLYCVYVGILVLLLAFVTGYTRYNSVLFFGLLLVIIGIIAYIICHRQRGKY